MSSGPKEGPFQGGGDRSLKAGSLEIVEEIGRGGMGVVFRAYDSNLDREVALKRPHLDLLGRPGFRSKFIDEARASSSLMHPNITTVLEVFEENAIPWMVMELVDGASLRSLLSERLPLSIDDVLKHAEGLTDALRVAHLAGTLHRDINPNNILIGKDNRARLSDFGLALARTEVEEVPQSSSLSTETDIRVHAVGTRGYMSPEQALGKRVDFRSDIFSLGLVFYEMCTGMSAFARPGSGDWLDALLHREPQPISELNSGVPFEFQEIIHRAIAKRKFQRYQSAKEMLIDVQAIRRRLDSDPNRTAPRVRKLSKQRSAGAAMLALAVVSTIAFIGWKIRQSPTESPKPMSWSPRQITSSPGWEGQPALSPDGTMIAFSSEESGNPDIFLLDIGGGEPLQLTHHPTADRDPTWTPDGSFVVYVSERGPETSIWKVPRLGGSPIPVMPDALNPAISRDGQWVAFSRLMPSGRLRIGVAPIGDPDAARMITGENQGFWDHENPSWSPDGRTICFSDFRDLWLVPADGSAAPQRLTTEHARDRNPNWSSDGTWIYFSSEREGTTAIWRVRSEGGIAERCTLGTGPEREPSLSLSGNRIAYSTSAEGVDVAVVNLENAEAFGIPGDRVDSDPAFAPDGRSVAFTSDREGKFDLWLQPLENFKPSGSPVKLTDLPGTVATPSFSHDGQWIAFFRVVDGRRDLWALASEGGSPIQLTDHEAPDIHPSFSPDGTQLAFVSNRSGEQEIWIAPFSRGQGAGEPTRLTARRTVGGMFPTWSPDGTRIAFVAHGEVFVASVNSNDRAHQISDGAGAHVARWEPSGDNVLVLGDWGTNALQLKRLAGTGGAALPLDPVIRIGDSDAPGLFSVSADGRAIAHLRMTTTGNIWLAEMAGDTRD